MVLRELSLAIKRDLAEEEATRRRTLKDRHHIQDHRRLLCLATVRKTISLVPASLCSQADQLARCDSDWFEYTQINLRYALGDDFVPSDATASMSALIEKNQDVHAQLDFHAWRAQQARLHKELAFGERC